MERNKVFKYIAFVIVIIIISITLINIRFNSLQNDAYSYLNGKYENDEFYIYNRDINIFKTSKFFTKSVDNNIEFIVEKDKMGMHDNYNHKKLLNEYTTILDELLLKNNILHNIEDYKIAYINEFPYGGPTENVKYNLVFNFSNVIKSKEKFAEEVYKIYSILIESRVRNYDSILCNINIDSVSYNINVYSEDTKITKEILLDKIIKVNETTVH